MTAFRPDTPHLDKGSRAAPCDSVLTSILKDSTCCTRGRCWPTSVTSQVHSPLAAATAGGDALDVVDIVALKGIGCIWPPSPDSAAAGGRVARRQYKRLAGTLCRYRLKDIGLKGFLRGHADLVPFLRASIIGEAARLGVPVAVVIGQAIS